VVFSPKLHRIPIGKAEVVREGEDLLILAIGGTVYPSLKAADELEKKGYQATVVNARFVKPLDEQLILTLAARRGRVLTVEENVAMGGFGSAVVELLSDHGLMVPVKRLAIPDTFVEQGSPAILREKYGLDAKGIFKGALELLEKPAQPKKVVWGNFS
jgi:1-deoxy-D-xylulose-5-phosphate synthase